MTPLVSLLIPTFNNALTIGETIESCLKQTFKDFEIVVYDECSKDKTREIVSQMAVQDPRIRLVSSDKNSGPVRAWIRLLHEAKGKYATFVWSDDIIVPHFLASMVKVLQDNPTHLVVGCNAFAETLIPDQRNADGTLACTPRTTLFGFETVRLKGDEFSLCVLAGYFPVTPLCSLFDRIAGTAAFERYVQVENPFGFDFSCKAYGNDFTPLSELALRAGEVIVIGEPMAVCRSSPNSLTVNAMRNHAWQFRLQYTYAMRHAWMLQKDLSPRMNALIRVADDRVHLSDMFYSWRKKVRPKYFNPFKILRAFWFLATCDRRIKPSRQPQLIQKWLANQHFS